MGRIMVGKYPESGPGAKAKEPTRACRGSGRAGWRLFKPE
ncbi:MAG: hypothetical protein ACI97B_004281, partial [Verrucomicrobiales bacterium]